MNIVRKLVLATAAAAAMVASFGAQAQADSTGTDRTVRGTFATKFPEVTGGSGGSGGAAVPQVVPFSQIGIDLDGRDVLLAAGYNGAAGSFTQECSYNEGGETCLPPVATAAIPGSWTAAHFRFQTSGLMLVAYKKYQCNTGRPGTESAATECALMATYPVGELIPWTDTVNTGYLQFKDGNIDANGLHASVKSNVGVTNASSLGSANNINGGLSVLSSGLWFPRRETNNLGPTNWTSKVIRHEVTASGDTLPILRFTMWSDNRDWDGRLDPLAHIEYTAFNMEFNILDGQTDDSHGLGYAPPTGAQMSSSNEFISSITGTATRITSDPVSYWRVLSIAGMDNQ